MAERKIGSSALTLIIVIMMSLVYGGIHSESLDLFHLSQIDQIVAFELRLPKILTAVIVGISLSLAGHIYQVMLSNSLAEPSLLGVSGFSSLFIVYPDIGSDGT